MVFAGLIVDCRKTFLYTSFHCKQKAPYQPVKGIRANIPSIENTFKNSFFIKSSKYFVSRCLFDWKRKSIKPCDLPYYGNIWNVYTSSLHSCSLHPLRKSSCCNTSFRLSIFIWIFEISPRRIWMLL